MSKRELYLEELDYRNCVDLGICESADHQDLGDPVDCPIFVAEYDLVASLTDEEYEKGYAK